MRSQGWSTILLAIAALSIPAYASSPDDKPINQDSIAALQARIPGLSHASNASSTPN